MLVTKSHRGYPIPVGVSSWRRHCKRYCKLLVADGPLHSLAQSNADDRHEPQAALRTRLLAVQDLCALRNHQLIQAYSRHLLPLYAMVDAIFISVNTRTKRAFDAMRSLLRRYKFKLPAKNRLLLFAERNSDISAHHHHAMLSKLCL